MNDNEPGQRGDLEDYISLIRKLNPEFDHLYGGIMLGRDRNMQRIHRLRVALRAVIFICAAIMLGAVIALVLAIF